jgi:pimeloyl-ACP methyl ester carboxylesterase
MIRGGSMFYRVRTNIFLVLVLFLWGCFPAAARPYRPLVFVPGILGSTLERDGKVVWGDQRSLSNFPELLIPFDEESGSINATGIIRSIAILGTIKIHQYDSLYETLKEIGYAEGENLFSFPYDWRKSNFNNADELDRFIESKPALQGEFDILAHSMGGLVTRIYIHKAGVSTRVRTLLNLAVPFQGSLSVLQTLEQGWGRLANKLAGGLPTIREVLLSFPSVYELLPRYPTCCIYGRPGAGREFDLLTEEFWQTYDVLPAMYKRANGKRFIAARLSKVRDLEEVVRRPLPPNVSERSVAGDLRDTASRVYLDPENRSPKIWQEERGDGTVVLMSASSGDVRRSEPAFASHQTIFNDDYVKILVQRSFDAAAGQFRDYAAPIPVIRREGRPPLEIQGLNLEVQPEIEIGENGRISLTVRTRQPIARGDIRVSLTIGDGEGPETPLEVSETTIEDARAQSATFQATFTSPAKPGLHQILARIPGIGTYDDYVLVLPK